MRIAPACFVLAFLVGLSFPVFAQMRSNAAPVVTPRDDRSRDAHVQRWSVGASFFFIAYSGDVDAGGMFPDGKRRWLVSGESFLRFRVVTFGNVALVNLRGTAGYYPMRASSTDYTFHAHDIGLSGCVGIEFFPQSLLRIEAAGGIGALLGSPTIDTPTERGRQLAAVYGSTEHVTPIVPLTVTLYWTLEKNLDFVYQFTKALTLSDRLDGWVSGINDNFQYVSFGAVLYF